MITNFQKDLEKGRIAEGLVMDLFALLSKDYMFVDVASDRECFHKGDILAIAPDGREIYIEVKNDSRIADTGHILCEEEVFYYRDGLSVKGNMYNNTDIYVVVSEKDELVYVIDFKVLQKNYKKGDFMVIPHAQQASYVYLLELCRIKQYGGLIATIDLKQYRSLF